MKTGILMGTILLVLLGLNASTESTEPNCVNCISIDTIIPYDTLQRIKNEAVKEATDSMLMRVQELNEKKDSLTRVVDSMINKPKRVLGHVDTIRGLNGINIWKWYYWKSGKKYRRFSHLEIQKL